MKCKIEIFCLLMFWNCILMANQPIDVKFIRDYSHSLSLSINELSFRAYQYLSYGCEAFVNDDTFNEKYLFKSQEFNQDLNLYLYPNRLYSTKSKCFFQVDSENQYNTPYSFLGADPVNYHDPDGNAGKLLVLHGEYRKAPADFEINSQVTNYKAILGDDVIYMPLSDVINKRAGPIREWNGDVYILSHTKVSGAKGILEIERAKELKSLKSSHLKTPEIETRFTSSGDVAVDLESKVLGQRLRELADKSAVDLNNIMVGGCKGAKVAEQIGDGITSASDLSQASRKFTSYGLKSRGVFTLGKTHGAVVPKEYYPKMGTKMHTEFQEFQDRRIIRKVSFERYGKSVRPKFSIEGNKEITDLANSRIADNVKHLFNSFPGVY